MKKLTKEVTQLLALLVLFCALLAGSFLFPAKTAQAAAKKATISATKMTVPVGKLSSKIYWNTSSWELEGAEKLAVKNAVKGATYQFTSSNTKVVKIGKTGGYLTGVKAGSATITCTQTLKGKKTKVGTCKVTVKKAGLFTSDPDWNDFAIGSYGYDLNSYYAGGEPLFQITYRNPDATYTVTSNSDDLTVELIKYDASSAKEVSDWAEYQTELKNYIGKRYFYGYQFTAKKAGSYTVTVKETYNKKTTTLGSFPVTIKDDRVVDLELYVGESANASSLIEYMRNDILYYFDIADYDETNPENNVVIIKADESTNTASLYGNKAGTVQIVFKEGSAEGPVVGTATVVVKEAPCESITLDQESYSTYVGDEYFEMYYELDPFYTTDKLTIESDSTDVLKVEFDEIDGDWVFTPLKAGEANVTFKCGSQSVTSKVTVGAEKSGEEW